MKSLCQSILITGFGLILISQQLFAGDRNTARIVPIPTSTMNDIRVQPFLSAADTCFVSQNGELVTIIEGWVVGQELYKSLMDPAASCPQPYPYTIVEINMPMSFIAGTALTISIDIEEVDTLSIPGCAIPGRMLTLSKDWDLTVPPGGGLFNIWIPLDTPIVVNGPFFAGFFIANIIDPASNPSLLIDANPAPCASYNIWDEGIGWVDLTANDFFNFPGRLAMEVSGIPGGQSGNDPPPAANLLTPANSDLLFGSQRLWVADSSGSSTIDYAVFEYSFAGAPFVEIGRDFDGSSPLRDGTNSAIPGSGFSLDWDFSGLIEGTYFVRATLFDLAGRSSSSMVTVTLEPTPPTPTIISPVNGSDFCQELSVIVNNNDEDLSFVQFERHDALPFYVSGITPVSQFTAGDANGNSGDGNFASNGEFGNYYSGPISAAMALRLWDSRGVSSSGPQGAPALTVQEISEQLADLFKTRANLGTFDEDLYSGLRSYLSTNNSSLKVATMRNPSYFNLRDWVEEQQRAVIIGLSGKTSIWLAVEGFGGWQRSDGYYDLKIVNSLNGSFERLPVRLGAGFSEIFFNSEWHRIDLMISLSSPTWTINRQLLGVDLNGADGWSLSWNAAGLREDSLYYVRASATDATSYRDATSVLLRYQCASVFTGGDYNGDASADVIDLIVLMDYITVGGAPPVGGGLRADANCDNFVNIADVVYYINFLFGRTGPPCY